MGFMQFVDTRLKMMGQMLELSSADLTRLPYGAMDQQFRNATYRCLGCRNTEACTQWLNEGNPNRPVPGFCPNAELMNSVRD